MSEFDTEGFFDNEWDGGGDLAWNEFDWERYLRCQDDQLHRYLAHYETLKGHPRRVDEVARLMGWDVGGWAADGNGDDESGADMPARAPEAEAGGPLDPYTLYKNPVFVATKAIYLSLKRGWEQLASDNARVSQPVALAVLTSLHRGEEHSVLGAQALDMGDYALAASLFKRALQELNRTLALINDPGARRHFAAWREDAVVRLFDLREIWLRVIGECREEFERRTEDEG